MTVQPEKEELITAEQAARLLLVKAVTIRAWAAQRRFTYVKLGKGLRIPRSEIGRLLAENMVPRLDSTNQ